MAGALILFVIPMTPWIARNLTAFRYPVTFSTNFEGALAAANCSTTYDTKSPFFAYWDIRCGIIDVPAGDASITARAWRSKAIDFATSHEDRLPVVAAGRLGRSWLVYRPLQQPGLDHIEGRPLQPSRVGLWSYALVAPLAVAGAVILRRRRVWMLPLLAIPLITTLTEVLVYATTRFRAPAEAVLVVFAAVAIDASLRARNVFGHLSRARHRR